MTIYQNVNEENLKEGTTTKYRRKVWNIYILYVAIRLRT